MEIVGKFTKDNKIVAWKISDPADDGTPFYENIPFIGIYSSMYFYNLVESGYVFHDYQGNVSYNGSRICDVPEVEEYLSMANIVEMNDMLEGSILDEVEICGNFKRSISTLDFLTCEKPDSYTINTREEFLEYLKNLNDISRKGIIKFNPNPVNSFVNPEALFTLDEVITNKDGIQYLYKRLFECHLMTYFDDFKKLVSDCDYSNDNKRVIMRNILVKYLKYGIPGIRANLIKTIDEFNPELTFINMKNPDVYGVKVRYGICDSEGKVYSEDVCGINKSSMNSASEYDVNAMFDKKDGIFRFGSIDFQDGQSSIAYGAKYVPPRMGYEFMNDDGMTAMFIMDINEAHLYYNGEDVFGPLHIFEFKTIDSIIIPSSEIILKGEEFISNSVTIRSFIRHIVKNSAVKPKYNNSFELVCGAGVSPHFASRFIAERLKSKSMFSSIPYEMDDIGVRRDHCHTVFQKGFSDYILDKYGDGSDDFKELSQQEQLEIMSLKVEELVENGSYLVAPEKGNVFAMNPEYIEYEKEYYDNEIDSMTFVYSILNGELNIGKFGLGIERDMNQNTERLFGVIYGYFVEYKQKNQDISIERFISLIQTGEIQIEFDKLISENDNAYRGAIYDELFFRAMMVSDASQIICVTKIFRENGNNTEVVRHYGFECLVYDIDTKSNESKEIFQTIQATIRKQLELYYFNNHIEDNSFISYDEAASVIFRIKLKTLVPYEISEGIVRFKYNCSAVEGKEIEVKFQLTERIYNKLISDASPYFYVCYSSCYDYSINQFTNDDNFACNIYCVNAQITPWNVIPRGNSIIKEYNIFLNYHPLNNLRNTFERAGLGELLNTAVSSGAKPIDNLKERFDNRNLFPSLSISSDFEDMSMALKGYTLLDNFHESLYDYIGRTSDVIKRAKAEGKAVKSPLLKSDIQFSKIKPYFFIDGVSTEDTFYDSIHDNNDKRYSRNLNVVNLNSEMSDSLMKYISDSSSKRFSVSKVKFTDIEYTDVCRSISLCNSDFNTSSIVAITQDGIRVGDKTVVLFSNLSHENFSDMDILVKERYAIPINAYEFIIKTINGLVKVGF